MSFSKSEKNICATVTSIALLIIGGLFFFSSLNTVCKYGLPQIYRAFFFGDYLRDAEGWHVLRGGMWNIIYMDVYFSAGSLILGSGWMLSGLLGAFPRPRKWRLWICIAMNMATVVFHVFFAWIMGIFENTSLLIVTACLACLPVLHIIFSIKALKAVSP